MQNNNNNSNQAPNASFQFALNNAQFNLPPQQPQIPQQQVHISSQMSLFGVSNTIPQQQQLPQQTGLFGTPQQPQQPGGIFSFPQQQQQSTGLYGTYQQAPSVLNGPPISSSLNSNVSFNFTQLPQQQFQVPMYPSYGSIFGSS